MNKYLLEIDILVPSMYLRNINHHHQEDQLLVEHQSETELFISLTKDPNQAKKFPNERYANDYVDNLNSMQPLVFSVVKEKMIAGNDGITAEAIRQDDIRQATDKHKPHDIMICRNCACFCDDSKCPQTDPDHVSCPAAEPMEPRAMNL